MAIAQDNYPADSSLEANLKKLEELSDRLQVALSRRKPADPGLAGPGNELYMKAAAAYMGEMVANPAKVIEHQVEYWGKTLAHMVEAQQALASGQLKAPEDRLPDDPRFKGALWRDHPYFNFLKQRYQMNSNAVMGAVSNMEGLSDPERDRVTFFAKQIVDMMAPSNFLATNPDALARAVETDGLSLVQGLENLVRDIEANEGDHLVTLADRDAFKVGENLGMSEGSVVFRNRLLELIQYTPTTETVHRTPIVLFPPWINKFYVLDLNPEKSLIKWIVDQGYTLFVVSWVNPDADYADVGMDDYVTEGYLKVFDVAKEICGEEQVNAIGYCIAGTTLALTLGLLHKRKEKTVRAATFFTTLTDFTDPGEVGVFLEDDFLHAIDRQVENQGYLDSFFMSRTFSYLRANDLIYGPAIRSYMMGEAPPVFDLLYWNGDSTNLPGKMLVEYLHGLCEHSQLSKGGFGICGEKVTLKDVHVPLMTIACETDHIAGWKASYNGVAQMASRDKTFVLAESGHIAGIISPPSKNKYNHYVGEPPSRDVTPDEWQEAATYRKGSWWPDWEAWIRRRSGKMVPARIPGEGTCKALCPAPGTYVHGAKWSEK